MLSNLSKVMIKRRRDTKGKRKGTQQATLLPRNSTNPQRQPNKKKPKKKTKKEEKRRRRRRGS